MNKIEYVYEYISDSIADTIYYDNCNRMSPESWRDISFYLGAEADREYPEFGIWNEEYFMDFNLAFPEWDTEYCGDALYGPVIFYLGEGGKRFPLKIEIRKLSFWLGADGDKNKGDESLVGS